MYPSCWRTAAMIALARFYGLATRAACSAACLRNVSRPKMSCAVWWAVHAAICSLCPPVFFVRWFRAACWSQAVEASGPRHRGAAVPLALRFARDGFQTRRGRREQIAPQIAAKTACRTRGASPDTQAQKRSNRTRFHSPRARARAELLLWLPSCVASKLRRDGPPAFIIAPP